MQRKMKMTALVCYLCLGTSKWPVFSKGMTSMDIGSAPGGTIAYHHVFVDSQEMKKLPTAYGCHNLCATVDNAGQGFLLLLVYNGPFSSKLLHMCKTPSPSLAPHCNHFYRAKFRSSNIFSNYICV